MSIYEPEPDPIPKDERDAALAKHWATESELRRERDEARDTAADYLWQLDQALAQLDTARRYATHMEDESAAVIRLLDTTEFMGNHYVSARAVRRILAVMDAD